MKLKVNKLDKDKVIIGFAGGGRFDVSEVKKVKSVRDYKKIVDLIFLTDSSDPLDVCSFYLILKK